MTTTRRVWRSLLRRPAWLSLGLVLSVAAATTSGDAAALKSTEMTDGVTCRIVESAAAFAGIPVSLLTRLVWTESRFRVDVTSAAGAEGIAQFMPETALERGLANPFDPEQAIPRAAEFLADLNLRFGNIGLAAAAYNAGPSRIESWLVGTGRLALETRAYVLTLTGRTVEDWAGDRQRQLRVEVPIDQPSCIAVVASLRAKEGERALVMAPDLPFEGNFLTAIAMARFEEARQRYCAHLDPHWRRIRAIALARRATTLDDLLPPLCSAYMTHHSTDGRT
jgi:Transglycosylase SLT domain